MSKPEIDDLLRCPICNSVADDERNYTCDCLNDYVATKPTQQKYSRTTPVMDERVMAIMKIVREGVSPCFMGPTDRQWTAIANQVKEQILTYSTPPQQRDSGLVESMRDLVKIQCSDGNWNYAPYMHGMANGMIMLLAMAENKEPEFLKAPDEWLTEMALTPQPPTESGQK